jgi:hypothetical protein
MKFRIANLMISGALILAPAIHGQEVAVPQGLAFAGPSNAPIPVSKSAPRAIQGQQDVLQLVAQNLNLSHQQKYQLETLLERQHELLVGLHQHTDMSDEQKSAEFQQIRRQTKEQFAAILTSQQRREFESMMR